MVNSNQKGKRREREFAQILRDFGFKARRSEQYCGANGDADVVSNIFDLAPYESYFEVKARERHNLYDDLEQAYDDSEGRPFALPIIAHKKNAKPWLITMAAVDFLDLIYNYNSMIRSEDGPTERGNDETLADPME